MAAYWSQSDDEPFASFINNAPKYVVSKTLRDVSWSNTTLISGDVARQIKDLKERIDGDIGMSGSATTVRWLLQNGLLEELNLLLHPIAVGSGRRLFEDPRTYRLELIESETFSTGVLNLTYAPAKG
jgi:dihydrofolate reductase